MWEKLKEFFEGALCNTEKNQSLQPRLYTLENGGCRILHDIVQLMQSLCNLTIHEEGEKYPTCSTIVPRLYDAEVIVVDILDFAEKGDNMGRRVLQCTIVANWRTLIEDLWNKYLEGFPHNDLLLTAMLVDPRNGLGYTVSYLLVNEAVLALTKNTINLCLMSRKLLFMPSQ